MARTVSTIMITPRATFWGRLAFLLAHSLVPFIAADRPAAESTRLAAGAVDANRLFHEGAGEIYSLGSILCSWQEIRQKPADA